MKDEERRAITMRLVGRPLTNEQCDVAEEAAAKILAEAFTMKLCKDCKHRKWNWNGWRCKVGEHIEQEMVTDPVNGKIRTRYQGFTGLPRCEYMRQENHAFVLHQCGPLGGMWAAKK
jgi:hypothetical protein